MLVMRSLQLLDKLSPAFSNQYLPFYSSVDGDENIRDQSDVFVDYDPNIFRHLIGQLRTHHIHREYIHKMISIIAHSVDNFRSISSN